jgi:hypothetical protein
MKETVLFSLQTAPTVQLAQRTTVTVDDELAHLAELPFLNSNNGIFGSEY